MNRTTREKASSVTVLSDGRRERRSNFERDGEGGREGLTDVVSSSAWQGDFMGVR